MKRLNSEPETKQNSRPRSSDKGGALEKLRLANAKLDAVEAGLREFDLMFAAFRARWGLGKDSPGK